MTRRPLGPVTDAGGRRANRMAPGGALVSESPIERLSQRRKNVVGGMNAEPPPPTPPEPVGRPSGAYISHYGGINEGDVTINTIHGWSSAVAYVASAGATGFSVPSGWTVLHSGSQGGGPGTTLVDYWLLKVDHIYNTESSLFHWASHAADPTTVQISVGYFGSRDGEYGVWGFLVGPTHYGVPVATWTPVGGAYTHYQVMHGTNFWFNPGNWFTPAAAWMSVADPKWPGPYDDVFGPLTPFEEWQENPNSGDVTWSGIGALGTYFSSSFAFVWNPA
jgi:hypothetical protein